jgi:hypothetical protein
LVGGIAGTAAEQAVADAKGWEYIVQEPGDKLVSVTQTSKTALPVGLHVLVIADTQQARIVPDYTVQTAAAAPTAKPAVTHATKTSAASNGSATTEMKHSPPPQATAAAAPLQVAPVAVASDPAIPSAPRPAAADPAAAPPAPSSTSGEAATPAPVNNANTATGTPPVGSPVTSVQVAPGVSITIPPASSSATAAP